jgi:hypothetical protein
VAVASPFLLPERPQLDTLLITQLSLTLALAPAFRARRLVGLVGAGSLLAWSLLAPEVRGLTDFLIGRALVHPRASSRGWGVDPETGLSELGHVFCGNDRRYDRFRSPRYDAAVRALARAFPNFRP